MKYIFLLSSVMFVSMAAQAGSLTLQAIQLSVSERWDCSKNNRLVILDQEEGYEALPVFDKDYGAEGAEKCRAAKAEILKARERAGSRSLASREEAKPLTVTFPNEESFIVNQ